MSLEKTKTCLKEKAAEIKELKEINKLAVYEHLIELGKKLPSYPEQEKTSENLVPGCNSIVYIKEELKNGKLALKGYAEAQIVKGQLAILLEALTGLAPKEIPATKPLIDEFINESGLKASLTPSRANSFGTMYRVITRKAEGLK